MPIYDGISAICVYDPTTGTTAEITKPIANSFEFSKRDFETGETSATGGKLYQGDSSSCSFSFLDPDGSVSTQLKAWKQARTRVSMVAIGPSVAVLWQETDHVSISPSALGGMVKGRADRWDFEIMREGHGQHAIYRQANLLAHVGWADSDSDEVADGYTEHDPGGGGTSTLTFASGQQTIEANELSGIYYDLVLPFSSHALSLTLSVDVDSLHTASSSYSLRLQWLNFAGTALQSSVATPTSTGRQSVTATGNTGLTAPYTLRVWPMLMPTSVSFGTMVGSDPALRLGGATSYVQA